MNTRLVVSIILLCATVADFLGIIVFKGTPLGAELSMINAIFLLPANVLNVLIGVISK